MYVRNWLWVLNPVLSEREWGSHSMSSRDKHFQPEEGISQSFLSNAYMLRTVCDNIMLSFHFGFFYAERLNRLNGRSVSSVCLTAFWQNGGKTIA